MMTDELKTLLKANGFDVTDAYSQTKLTLPGVMWAFNRTIPGNRKKKKQIEIEVITDAVMDIVDGAEVLNYESSLAANQTALQEAFDVLQELENKFALEINDFEHSLGFDRFNRAIMTAFGTVTYQEGGI